MTEGDRREAFYGEFTRHTQAAAVEALSEALLEIAGRALTDVSREQVEEALREMFGAIRRAPKTFQDVARTTQDRIHAAISEESWDEEQAEAMRAACQRAVDYAASNFAEALVNFIGEVRPDSGRSVRAHIQARRWLPPRTFLGFSSTDIHYFRTMQMWKGHDHIEFDFVNVQLPNHHPVGSQGLHQAKTVLLNLLPSSLGAAEMGPQAPSWSCAAVGFPSLTLDDRERRASGRRSKPERDADNTTNASAEQWRRRELSPPRGLALTGRL